MVSSLCPFCLGELTDNFHTCPKPACVECHKLRNKITALESALAVTVEALKYIEDRTSGDNSVAYNHAYDALAEIAKLRGGK